MRSRLHSIRFISTNAVAAILIVRYLLPARVSQQKKEKDFEC
nr:MAG TPA: NADH-ubiquinone/plastoquinone oxidoreductase, chain 3 [Caudoviricetes sp.]